MMAEYIYRLAKDDGKLLAGTIQIENCICTDEQIIRCRDCGHYDKMSMECKILFDGVDPFDCLTCKKVDANGFCAWAEQKKGTGDE